MNGMYGSQKRSLSSDHPVNPVHPVPKFLFPSAVERYLDRINKMNRDG